jgi:hypothetical protein
MSSTAWTKKQFPEIINAKHKPAFSTVATQLYHVCPERWVYVFLFHTKGKRAKDTRYVVFAPNEMTARLLFYRYDQRKPKARHVPSGWINWCVTRTYYQTLTEFKDSFNSIAAVQAANLASSRAVLAA